MDSTNGVVDVAAMTETNMFPPAPVWVSLSAVLIRHLPAGRYRFTHWLRRYSPAEFLMPMRRELGGHAFICNLRDSISREVCFTGYYEPQETAIVRSILRPGMNFVDVGANWGYFTLLSASLVGEKGRVLSLEPDPRLFPMLCENIARSGLDHVTALQLAAADKARKRILAGYQENNDNFGISRIVSASNGHDYEFQVETDSLDHVLAQHHLESVDLMKMDIEGAEAFAISGLGDSLRNTRVKRLLLELHPVQLAEHGSDIAKLIQTLHAAGYRAWTIDHSLAATRYAAYETRVNVAELLRSLSMSDHLATPVIVGSGY
jgi:FkbM family methyltransferase